MALAETADGRIAGHRSDGCEPMGHQRGLRTHPRSRARGLTAGVAATDNDDVEGVGLGGHAATSISELENAEARILWSVRLSAEIQNRENNPMQSRASGA